MEKPEYFIVKPSVKTFGGIRVTKDTDFDIYNDDKTVHQILKDFKLTTEIKKEYEYKGLKMKEESKVETEIPEGMILIYSEETGYVISEYPMVKAEEAIEALEKLKDITKPIEEHNKEE